MSTLVAGIKHIRDGIEAQAVLGSDMSTVGLVGTAPGADPLIFPLNQPIVVRTNDTALRAGLGSTGTIVDALVGISAQVGYGIGAARTVVVRVEDDADADVVIANIVGSEVAESGIWALLDAPEELAVTPRIIITPGYTSQTNSGNQSIAVTNAGSGYTAATVSFTGGGGTGLAADVTVSDGIITAITITDAGTGYTSAPAAVIAGDGSDGAATVSYGQLANAVCAMIPTILERLRGVFIPEGPTDTRQNAINWLETLPQNERILHPLRQVAKTTDENGDIVTKPLSPYMAGLYVRRDAEKDGTPGHAIANQNINGLVGLSPSIPFSITDASSLGQEDLGYSFGICFRGDLGVDGSLTDGGFGFWGTDTLSPASEWLFANVVRMRDYLELLQVKALRYYLGRFNITQQTVQAIVNTMESQLSKLRAEQHILDYRISFDPDANTPEELRLGELDLTFEAEEPPVLRKIILRSRRHRAALETLVRSIAIQLGTQVGSE